MRTVKPENLVPYCETDLTDEEREAEISRLRAQAARRAFARRPEEPSPDAIESRMRIVKRQRAEFEWIKANLPIGSIFDHMGVPVMVVSSLTFGPESKRAHITCHCAGTDGGLQQIDFTVTQLRAILEPGYVSPYK